MRDTVHHIVLAVLPFHTIILSVNVPYHVDHVTGTVTTLEPMGIDDGQFRLKHKGCQCPVRNVFRL